MLGSFFRKQRAGWSTYTKRNFGFSSLTPRTLDAITDLPKLSQENPDTIKQIWEEFHNTKQSSLGSIIDRAIGENILSNGKKCPMFIVPVFKSKDSYMIVLSQFQDNFFLVTFLEEFRQNPATASPWLSLNLYNELLNEKGIYLSRGDFLNHLTKHEAGVVAKMIMEGYGQQNMEMFNFIEKFNLSPHNFRFEDYIQYCNSNFLADFTKPVNEA